MRRAALHAQRAVCDAQQYETMAHGVIVMSMLYVHCSAAAWALHYPDNVLRRPIFASYLALHRYAFVRHSYAHLELLAPYDQPLTWMRWYALPQ